MLPMTDIGHKGQVAEPNKVDGNKKMDEMIETNKRLEQIINS